MYVTFTHTQQATRWSGRWSDDARWKGRKGRTDDGHWIPLRAISVHTVEDHRKRRRRRRTGDVRNQPEWCRDMLRRDVRRMRVAGCFFLLFIFTDLLWILFFIRSEWREPRLSLSLSLHYILPRTRANSVCCWLLPVVSHRLSRDFGGGGGGGVDDVLYSTSFFFLFLLAPFPSSSSSCYYLFCPFGYVFVSPLFLCLSLSRLLLLPIKATRACILLRCLLGSLYCTVSVLLRAFGSPAHSSM